MKVKESEYLKIKKPIWKKLLSKLLDKYEYASIQEMRKVVEILLGIVSKYGNEYKWFLDLESRIS